MVLLYLTNGTWVEVPEASSVVKTGGKLFCLDTNGRMLAEFNLTDVSLYTSDPDTARLIRQELDSDSAPGDSS